MKNLSLFKPRRLKERKEEIDKLRNALLSRYIELEIGEEIKYVRVVDPISFEVSIEEIKVSSLNTLYLIEKILRFNFDFERINKLTKDEFINLILW